MDMADTYKYSSNDGVNKHEAGYMMLYHNAKPPFVTYGFETYKGVEEKLQYRTARTKAGYAVELRLAMSDSLKARLAEGEHPKIGIGFQINDDTNQEMTESEITRLSPTVGFPPPGSPPSISRISFWDRLAISPLGRRTG